MRKMYETDLKNRVTSVTEVSLTRTGVKKNTYMTEYTNTNLIELDESSTSTIADAIGAPMTEIANALSSSEDAQYKMIPCNATAALNDFVITEPIVVESASVVIYEGYTLNTTISVFLCVGDEESEIESVVIDQELTDTFVLDLNYTAEIASEDNPIKLKATFTGNDNETATAVISYKYYKL